MYTIVLMYQFQPKWLRLDWQQRAEFRAQYIAPIFDKYAEVVQAKFCDSEAFDAEYSDFMVLTTGDLKRYYYLIEELRETPLFSEEFVVVNRILMGLEDGHLEFEQTLKKDEVSL